MTPRARWLVSALLLAVFAPPARAADSSGDLAIKARAILKKHCAECHSGEPDAPSTLSILEYTRLIDKKRPFVNAKNANDSQVIHFIEEGSMPPGNKPKLTAEEVKAVRAWIEGGAAEYPKAFDDAFAHAVILKDLQSAPADFKSFRYFTLHHLLADDAIPSNLGALRETFRKALSGVAHKEQTALKAVDPFGTIFRVSLVDLGWDGRAFRHVQPSKPPLEVPFTIFDFLLLEYPFGEMPPATKDAEQLAELWLRHITQVRPVIFVRADWFAKAVDGTPLKSDVRKLLQFAAAKPRSIDIPDKKGPPIKLEDLPPLPPIRTGKAIPIVAIDAWYAGDYQPKGGPKVDVFTLDVKGEGNKKFKPGERVKLEVRSDTNVFIDLIHIDPEGTVYVDTPADSANRKVRAGVPKEVEIGGNKGGLLLGEEPGSYRFIVFAAAAEFPEGELLQSKHVEVPIERFVHRFYELPRKIGDPPEHEASKMARTTAIIAVK